MPGCFRLQALRDSHILSSGGAALAVGLALTALGPPAIAQSAGGAGTNDAQSGPLQEVIVTATRHAERLSHVPLSVTALTQSALDMRGVRDFNDIAKFTPGVEVDNTGTNNISIRGIASTGGAGTTGIYIDDTPIQMRALAFNPDEALPQTFDVQRVEVLRGPQGTLFGAGSEGGTVRYITTPPSLTQSSIYSRDSIEYTQGGAPSYEAGIAGGMPIIPGKLGVRADVWYRRDGGYINLIDPVSLASVSKNANYADTSLFRLAAVWAINDHWRVTPTFYYQDRYAGNTNDYWPLYSNAGKDQYVSADPTRRGRPDRFYLPSLKIVGHFSKFDVISNTAYYHRKETSGYDGTIYNLGFYQSFEVFNSYANGLPLLLDGNGLHLPPGATDYRSPATVDNGQQNLVEELRLQSNDASSPLTWTTGLFFSTDRQSYLEQIHDPLLNELTQAYVGSPYGSVFCNYNAVTQTCGGPILYDPRFPNDSYFLQTFATDKQYAWYGEATYAFTQQWKLTLGARESHTQYSFNTLTGGPQLFLPPQTGSGGKSENAFTPKVSIAYQHDPDNLYYATYAKGFRPGGGNPSLPSYCDGTGGLQQTGYPNGAPLTYNSDTTQSFEIGAKNAIANRLRVTTSIYYVKWNNIQQSVYVAYNCGLQFTDNLGTAVSKGFDLQADMLLGGGFTANAAVGYTSARYTASTPAPKPLLVLAGDAISGQAAIDGGPGTSPPWTVSVGAAYHFHLARHRAFLRMNWEYQSRNPWLAANQDPRSVQYDPYVFTLSSTTFASVRGGMDFGPWQVSLFVNNLFDSRTTTNYELGQIDANNPNGAPPQQQNFYTYRPRTIGITATFRD